MSSFESSSSTDSTSFDDFLVLENSDDWTNQASDRAMKLHQQKMMQKEQDSRMMQINSIIHCCEAGNFEKLQSILDDPTYDAAINSYADRLAHDAVSYGTPETARLILNDVRIDPSGSFNSALCYALQNSKYEMARLLLQNERLDLSQVTNNQQIVSFATVGQNEGLLQLLLQHNQIVSNQDEVDCAFRKSCHCSRAFRRLLITKYGSNVFKQIPHGTYNSLEFEMEHLTSKAIELIVLRPVVNGLHNIVPEASFRISDGKLANRSLAFFLYCIGFRNYVINQDIKRKSVSKAHATFVLQDGMQLLFGLKQLNLPVLLKCHLIDTVTEPLTNCVPWHWLWLYASSVKIF